MIGVQLPPYLLYRFFIGRGYSAQHDPRADARDDETCGAYVDVFAEKEGMAAVIAGKGINRPEREVGREKFRSPPIETVLAQGDPLGECLRPHG